MRDEERLTERGVTKKKTEGKREKRKTEGKGIVLDIARGLYSIFKAPWIKALHLTKTSVPKTTLNKSRMKIYKEK